MTATANARFRDGPPGVVLLEAEGLRLVRPDGTPRYGVGGEVAPVVHQTAVGTVAATTDTANWQEWLAASRVLPAGTWEVALIFSGVYYLATASGGMQARVGAPFAGPPLLYVNGVSVRGPAVLAAEGTAVSDGVTPTPFRVEYRRVLVAGNGTPWVEHGALLALLRRVG